VANNKDVVFAIVLGQRDVAFGATTMEGLIHLAEWTDRSASFGALFCGDSFLAKPRVESIVFLSAVAARTRRVRLGPACMASFPLRHPVWLAHQWASLDVISKGRALMVACIGGGSQAHGGDFQNEYRAMGMPFSTRASRLEEGVEILRRLWSEERVTHKGEFYEFQDVSIVPKPVQKRIPIWLASNVNEFTDDPALRERPLRRAARIADGWLTAATSPHLVKENWERIRTFAADYGRDPDDLDCCLQLTVNIDDDSEKAYAEMKRFLDAYHQADWPRHVLENWGAWGSVDACANKIGRWVATGATYVSLRLASWELERQFELVSERLIPQLRQQAAK
jgi:alkanesulfonate monooxygenase SsuD/methylene tetrahydromethanopterin reductase-like flavin-dependent oxidoreductase (luciferase family)